MGAGFIPENAARNFGLALVILGVGLLVLGVWHHLRFMHELRAERAQMIKQGLIHGQLSYPVSYLIADAETFWTTGDEQVQERFKSKQRHRAGIAWRKDAPWTFQLIYTKPVQIKAL